LAEINISIEKLFDKTGSIYKLVTLASKRALELNGGAPKITETESDKIYLLALQEIIEGKITYKAKS
jgi:DNA-directed RNA polymerase omega subunit